MNDVMKLPLIAAGLTALLALEACQTASPVKPKPAPPTDTGKVSYALLPADSAGQLKLKRGEHAFGAQPITRDPPAYPASLIGQALPATTIRVKAIVDENGKVTEVRDLEASTSAAHAAFLDACRAAVLQWTYTPMTVVQEFDDGKGNITQARKTSPFSLDYAFRFELVNGKPTVSAAE